MAFAGRYVLVLMGFFAFYCGTIYNDCMSIPIDVFGSTWEYRHNASVSSLAQLCFAQGSVCVQTAVAKGGVYPYGEQSCSFGLVA